MSNTSSEVLAYCGSCKMDLNATVVANVGGKIAKVQCRTCKKEHAFKAPKGVSDPTKTPPKATGKKKAADDEGSSSKSLEAEWQRLMNENSKAPRVKYSAKSKIDLGQVVQHPMFGDGIVMRVIHPDKAEILFRNDMKILIHSR